MEVVELKNKNLNNKLFAFKNLYTEEFNEKAVLCECVFVFVCLAWFYHS